ncbi:MAG: hypothetical protein QOG64_2088 [Acidimicrobiaceae bacterium]|nr:hypothetical protein [Acidimicrobiaceae bacterium]
MTRRVVVIGGGIGGGAAALRLARAGCAVTVVERGERLGGLVTSFAIGGTPLECFYHHIFPHEHEIRGLIDELGLGPRLEWRESSVGVFTGGSAWPFTTPADLLRFGPLRFRDRLRAGVGALRMSRVEDWQRLDGIPATEWLRSYTGAAAAEVVWDPLLRAKFGPAAATVPAAWMWGRLQQRSGARSWKGERLGYLRGGFRQLFDALAGELERLGVEIRVATSVEHIDVDGSGAVEGVATSTGHLPADAVLYTGSLRGLLPLVPPSAVDARWSAIGRLGVLCVVLEVERQAGPFYWTNVCDPDLPFGGVIEHTNMLPTSDYGCHVVYLSRYFTEDEPIAAADPATEAARWVEIFSERWPGVRPGDVTAVHPFRTLEAAPLVMTGHLGRIPPVTAEGVRGLFVSTTAQIYPQDRGMSEGVRTGTASADTILAGWEMVGATR